MYRTPELASRFFTVFAWCDFILSITRTELPFQSDRAAVSELPHRHERSRKSGGLFHRRQTACGISEQIGSARIQHNARSPVETHGGRAFFFPYFRLPLAVTQTNENHQIFTLSYCPKYALKVLLELNQESIYNWVRNQL